jgi:Tol biopolymer transport system component
MQEPDGTAVPATVPASVVTVIRRCLQKDRAQRARDVGDVSLALEGAFATVAPQATTPAAPLVRRVWAALALGVVGLASLASTVLLYRRSAPEQPSIQFVVSAPDGWSIRKGWGGAQGLALSPDGRRLAFVAADKVGQSLIWVRSLDAAVAQPLKGTEGADVPFWSPNSQWLAFIAADKRLKKIDVAGGPPQTIADVVASIGGGSWSADGVLLFNATGNGPLSRVSAEGGVVTPVTSLETGELRHVNPRFLPDGQHFLYSSFGANGVAVYVGSLNGKAHTLLLRDVGDQAAYSEGRLFFVRADTLMTQRFDAATLTLGGEPSTLVEIPGGTFHDGTFSVSTTGVLAYQSGTNVNRDRLEWFDRAGTSLGALGEAANYYTAELSADGSYAAGSIWSQASTPIGDVWLYDVTHNDRKRLTFDAANTWGRAVWAPDGKHLVYGKKRGAQAGVDLVQIAADGVGDEQVVLEDGANKLASSWSPDARFLLYMATTNGSKMMVLPLFGDRKPFPFPEASALFGQFSPNGRWVAYVSNESGRVEVYVAAFPGASGKRQISTAGGWWPRWRRDGKEIFYLALNGTLMAAAVNGQGTSFEVTSVKALFEAHALGDFPYDVSADGQRFLIVRADDDTSAAGITVTVNGPAGPTK